MSTAAGGMEIIPYLRERLGQLRISPLCSGKHAKKERTPMLTITPPIMGGVLCRVVQNHFSEIGTILCRGMQNLPPFKEERFCARIGGGSFCRYVCISGYMQ